MLPDDDAALLRSAEITPPEDPAEGLFPASCWLRRVSGEPALLLGGGRALLLEVAHPLVAAGVAEHSDFRRDPFGRLQRTLDAMSAIVFRDRDAALAAARGVARAHGRVTGTLSVAAGPFPADTPYSGRDPELVRWVWASLLDTALVVYQRFVRPLSQEALEAYHTEQAALARLLGVPAEQVPGAPAAFRRFMDETLASPVLTVSQEAREIARAVLETPAGPWGDMARLLAVGLLPGHLREAFGLDWDAAREQELAELEQQVAGARRGRPDAVDGRIEPR